MKERVVFRIPRSKEILRSSYGNLFSCLSVYVENYKKACVKSRNGQKDAEFQKASAADR